MIIHTFGGTAKIMGVDMMAHYENRTLTLTNVGSVEQAEAIIKFLEGNTAWVQLGGSSQSEGVTVTVGRGGGSGGSNVNGVAHVPFANGKALETQDFPRQAEEHAKTKPTMDPAKIAAIAAANPAKAPKEEKPKKAKMKQQDLSLEDAESPAEEVEVEEAAHSPTVQAAVAKAKQEGKDPITAAGLAAAAEADDAAPTSDVPQALLEAKKLRDVITYLMDVEGITDTTKLKARCVELQETVPCLARISEQLESRVDRTIEVMDMAGELS